MKTRHSLISLHALLRPAAAHIATAALLLLMLPAPARPQALPPDVTIRDIATDETDPNDFDDSEPSIAVDPTNPRNIVIVAFSEKWGATASAPIWRSTDGGLTWRKVRQIPRPSTQLSGPSDQKLAFDSAGRLFAAQMDEDLQDFVYRQGGAAEAALTAGGMYGDDQPHLEVDRTATSPCFNRVYSPWREGSRSMVMRSSDSGVTVEEITAGSPDFPNRTTRIAVAPDGSAYIIYKTREGEVNDNFENAHFRVERSDDCGATWDALGATGVPVHEGTAVTWFTQSDPETNQLIIGFGNPSKGKVARARSSDAWIAVDPASGDVYAAYVHRDASGFGQIYVARSTDRGATWSSRRVTNGTHHSAFPEIAVAGNGTVGVLYIDFDDSGQKTIFRHNLARSFTRNALWSSVTLQSMDPDPIENATNGWLWGDYEGLTAVGDTFYGVFTGESIGRTTLQLDPIFFTASAIGGGRVLPLVCQLKPHLCIERDDLRVIECAVRDCLIFNPLEKICVGRRCPVCPGRRCEVFNVILGNLGDPWKVQVFDPKGRPVAVRQTRKRTERIVSFRPSAEFADRVGDYSIAVTGGKVGSKVNLRPRLEVTKRPIR